MSIPYPPTAPPATTSSSTVPPPTPISTRNPLPLSAAQEGQVRDLYYKRVRSLCANEIRDFASCALNRTFSATWACRPQRLAMNNCMVAHATVEQQDAAREEWFATKDQRRKEREEKEAKRKEAEKLHHEYWGLDEQGRRIWDADKAGGKR
ncbi:hypothetical protein W97_06411 [Coniosporium apollinis CBS 100218]|uniref:COX assembly mitochondrial protein n=1 Tax=Coniosporium apollinis (strain CBS 100218) TaxID=1168221 RepID=R7YZ99_CONA1|nr:uncharacterized protein W97_06411 [Coniosporium apollinis CBS 100218]EON67158.1 hypothetical protein W97_06411 [Coniosporium apollinis CBS 100218]